ncbi:MAG TPA: hypothetical protein VH814_22790 [Steroidobacteraceae bacterium]
MKASIAVCACLAVLAVAPRAHADNAVLPGVYINDQQNGAAIGTAIETAIEKMNFIKRPIARSRLKKTNAAHHRVTIGLTAQEISVAFDNAQPVRMPADGSTAKWTREDGEVFDVSARWTNDRLVQSFKAPDGERINTFALGSEGRALEVQVEVRSPQLPEPVRYALTFVRQ